MSAPRIISFLPAATEMAYALGLGEAVAGVSHECDFPPEARTKPVVVKPALPLDQMSLSQIDVEVARRIGSGQSLYEVDERLLRELRPDMILTQNLCQVCGPSGNEITVALKLLQPNPEIVWMTPHSLADIFQNICDLGRVTNRGREAEALVAAARERLNRVVAKYYNTRNRPLGEFDGCDRFQIKHSGLSGHDSSPSIPLLAGRGEGGNARVPSAADKHSEHSHGFSSSMNFKFLRKGKTSTESRWSRPRVLCLEWTDPYYCCGHWVPEMVELAGGEDALGRKGVDSVRISWKDIAAWAPEVLIVSPCGFGTRQAVAQANEMLRQPGWGELPAVRNNRVFAVDANAYFARPGPRVVDGVELLAHLIHPELFEWRGPAGAFQQVDTRAIRGLPVRVKACPECGQKFVCGPQAGGGCWCDELPPVSPPAGSATDCLCPACLVAKAKCSIKSNESSATT